MPLAPEQLDARLIARARRGDRDAFASLVERHARPLYALAVALTSSSSDADDLVQEAFLVAWRDLAKLDDASRWKPWLTAIVRQQAARLLRARGRDRRRLAGRAERLGGRSSLGTDSPSPAPQSAPPLSSGDLAVEREEAAEIVRSAVGSLPAELRLPLVLFYYEGESTGSVAVRLGKSPAAIRKRLERARRRLRDQLDPRLAPAILALRPPPDLNARVLSQLPPGPSPTISTSPAAPWATAGGSFAGALAVTSKSAVIVGAVLAALVLPIWFVMSGWDEPGADVEASTERSSDLRALEPSGAVQETAGVVEAPRGDGRRSPLAARPAAKESPAIAAKGFDLTLTVVDRATNRPLAGVTVEATPLESTDESLPGVLSDDGGQVVFEALDSVPWRLQARSTEDVEVGELDRITVRPGQAEATLAVDARYRLGGRLVMASRGAPAPDVFLVAEHATAGLTGLAKTDADGRFRADRLLPPGEAELMVQVPPGLRRTPSDFLPVGRAVVGEEDTRHLELEHPWWGRIEGRVEDPSGRPIAGAELGALLASTPAIAPGGRVSIYEARRAESDERGRFRIDLLPVGVTLIVFCQRSGFAAHLSRAITLTEGRAELTIVLSPSAHFAGRVFRPDGSPAVGAQVSAYNAPIPSPGTVETDAEGRFEFRDIGPETYTVTAQLPPFEAVHRHDVEVRSDALNEIELHLRDDGLTITGRTIDSKGRPLPRVMVTARRASRGSGALVKGRTSDESGEFQLQNLEPGLYELIAFGDGLAQSAPTTFEAGSADVELRLPAADREVEVQLLSAIDATPLVGGSVYVRSSDRASYRQTNEQGRVAFDLVPGEFDLLCAARGHAPRRVPIELSPDQDEPFEVKVNLDRGVPVSGRVLDVDGRPVEGATVCLYFGGSLFRSTAVYSDDDGRFTIDSLPIEGAQLGLVEDGAPFPKSSVEVEPGREPILISR